VDDRVAHHANAVRIGDHHRTFKETGFLDPGGAGHFAVAVERPPAGKNGIAHGILPTRENGGDAGAHGAFADLKLAFAGNKRGVPDGNSGNVSYGVERARSAVKRGTEVAGAGFCTGFFLSI
jgi:hypothetical protein